MAEYYMILTVAGQAAYARAGAGGSPVQISAVAVGDGGGVAVQPAESWTALVGEVWRGAPTLVEVDEANPRLVLVEAHVPHNAGGWYAREIGLLSPEGVLLAVGNYPESYKPVLDSGVGKELLIRAYIEHGNASQTTLIINPDIVMASRTYVASAVATHDASPTAHAGQLAGMAEHIDDLANPHQVTAAQAGAEPAGKIAWHNGDEEAHADIRALIAALGGSRVETLWLGAGAMIPRKANGATAGTDQSTSYLLMSDYLDFGADINRAAQAVFHLPGNWDRGSIKAKVHWMPAVAGATAGQYVGWAILCGAVGDGDVVDRSLGTGVIVDDQVLAGLGAVEHVTSASADITVSGEPQIGDRLQLVVVRQPAYTGGGTALPVAARLLGIEIQYGITGNAAAWS
jgi:Phage-related tail fibre protein